MCRNSQIKTQRSYLGARFFLITVSLLFFKESLPSQIAANDKAMAVNNP